MPLRIAFLVITGDYGLTEIIKQMMHSKRVVSFINPHQKKGKVSDPHYNEKLEDDFHLLDIINIMNYLAIVAENDEEVKTAASEYNTFFSTGPRAKFPRLSNYTL